MPSPHGCTEDKIYKRHRQSIHSLYYITIRLITTPIKVMSTGPHFFLHLFLSTLLELQVAIFKLLFLFFCLPSTGRLFAPFTCLSHAKGVPLRTHRASLLPLSLSLSQFLSFESLTCPGTFLSVM